MKLDNKRTVLIGFAFLAISAFWQVYDNIVPLILKYFFHIGDTLSGGIMALDNILALFLLPIFGAWSDKVHTRTFYFRRNDSGGNLYADPSGSGKQ